MKVKLLNYKFTFLLATLLGIFAQAEVTYKATAAYRSVPSSANIVTNGAYEGLLWGKVDKQNPMYGYYRVGVVLGLAPTTAVFAEVAPIAPLVFKLQQSMTYRFAKSQIFDCKTVYCFGVANRTDATVSLAGAYQGFVGAATYLWRNLTLPSSENSVMSELELFLTTPGEHFYNEMTVTVGYQLEDKKIIGLHHTSGRFSDGDRKSSSLYAVYRFPWQDWDLAAGVGSYTTDQAYVGGQGVVFSIGKKFGESLSLF